MKKALLVMAALAAALALAAPALAAEPPGPTVVVGGRIRMDFGYQRKAKELTTNQKSDVTTAFMNLSAYSYLNAVFTSADKTSGGKVELGLNSKIDDAESVSLRYAYGWYKMGNWRLVAGQTDSWLGSLAYLPRQEVGLSQSGKVWLTGFGYLYSGRHPQARIEWSKDAWGFSLALVQPGAEEATFATSPSNVDLYANFPSVELAVEFKSGGFMTTPAIGWTQLKYEGVVSGVDDTVTGWIATLPVKFTAGALTVKGGVHYGYNTSLNWDGEGVNLSALRSAGSSQPDSVPVWNSDGKVEDTKFFGGFLSLEYAIQKWTLIGGVGAEQLSNDNWKKPPLGYKDDEYTRYALFVALPYQFSQNFGVHPELSYWNYGDLVTNGEDGGDEWLLGVQFRWLF